MFLTLLDNITIPALVLLFPQDGFSNSSRYNGIWSSTRAGGMLALVAASVLVTSDPKQSHLRT